MFLIKRLSGKRGKTLAGPPSIPNRPAYPTKDELLAWLDSNPTTDWDGKPLQKGEISLLIRHKPNP